MTNSWKNEKDDYCDWQPDHILKDALAAGAVDGDVIIDITTGEFEKSYFSNKTTFDFFPVYGLDNKCRIIQGKPLPPGKKENFDIKGFVNAWEQFMFPLGFHKLPKGKELLGDGTGIQEKLSEEQIKKKIGESIYFLFPFCEGTIYTYAAHADNFNSVTRWFSYTAQKKEDQKCQAIYE